MSTPLQPAIAPTTPKPRARHGRWQVWLDIIRRDKRPAWGIGILMVFVVLAAFAPLFTPFSPTSTSFTPMMGPSAHHWFGTTASGQDIWAQFLYGGRISLSVGFVAGAFATFLAIVLGMLPAYLGGWIDSVMATLTNIMLVIPGLPLLIVITAYVHQTGPVTIVFVIGLTGWAWGARILRAQTLTMSRRDFVAAARLAGESRWRVLVAEILPNMLSLVIANLVFATIGAILAEASLEFLGLGNPSAVTWGTMLFWADSGGALLNGAWWWIVPPGLAIALVGLSLALINFGVDQVSNPRLRVQRVKSLRPGDSHR